MKPGAGKNKGSGYAHVVCKQLSLWWTADLRDDVFYPSQGSGGRATRRAIKGITTPGQYGDICCTDPIGQPFMKTFVVEVKRGYNDATIQDLLDKPNSTYLKWFEKAERDRKAAGVPLWMLVVKRDRRDDLVFMPLKTASAEAESMPYEVWDAAYIPSVCMTVKIQGEDTDTIGVRWEGFLKAITPDYIRKSHEDQ